MSNLSFKPKTTHKSFRNANLTHQSKFRCACRKYFSTKLKLLHKLLFGSLSFQLHSAPPGVLLSRLRQNILNGSRCVRISEGFCEVSHGEESPFSYLNQPPAKKRARVSTLHPVRGAEKSCDQKYANERRNTMFRLLISSKAFLCDSGHGK